MFARNRFKKEKDVDLFISKTWKEITSSVELIEMSTNPSMLQLICLLSAQTGKIGKDRAEVFKHYTQYLLIQYHSKHHKGVPYSDKLYKDDLLKCGKLAMFGLKQNHLQLVFSKQEATEIAGSVIFDLGFLTELPSIDIDKVKVQFLHKSLQEYLAAFYVVNTPGDEGVKILMEFCSTSQKLMGSQIILNFIAAMSKKMGKVIQKQIKDYISSWDSNVDVDPKSRTSFLISMLKDNKKLTFPLPAILDIDLQVYDLVSKRIRNFIKSLFGQKSTLERFLIMDGRGVKKINIGVGQYNRLGLLLNNSFTSLEELLINYKNTHSKDDPEHLNQVITTNKPRLISITNCVHTLFNKDLITKIISTPHVQTVILRKCQIYKDNCLLIIQTGHHLNSLIIQECGIQIGTEVAKAACDLPDETQIDLSGNKIVQMEKTLLISLIYKIRKQKQIDLRGAKVDINSEIAKAVCDLPDETQIDLSGNKIVQMEKTLLISLIYKIRKQKQIDLRGANIDIDSEIAKAVCDLPDETQIDLSGNKINKLDRTILGLIVTQLRKNKQIDVTRFNIEVDSKLVNAICDIPGDIQLDLFENKIFQINPRILMSLIYKINTMKEIDLSGLNIDIDGEIAKAVCDLPDEAQVDLSGNKIVKMDKHLLISLIYKIRKQKEIDLGGANIDIDSEIAKAVCDLPDETQIVLSGNTTVKIDNKILITLINKVRIESEIDLSGLYIRVHDGEACVIWDIQDNTQIGLYYNKQVKIGIKKFMSIIYKITNQKEIDLSGLNIDIDSEIAKAVCDLPDVQIDLSGNKLIQMETTILTQLINKIRTQKQIDLERTKIQIDTEIAKAVCGLPDEKIVLSGNTTVKLDTKILITLINKVRIETEVDLSGLYLRVDDREPCVIWEIHDKTKMNLQSNKIVKVDFKKFMSIIYKIATQKEIDLSGLNIGIDTELVKCISELPEDVQIDLSDNKITDESLIASIIKQSTKLKSVTMRNCGIEINKQIAEAVSELNDDTKLDLSGNEITKMEAGLLGKVLKYMKKQEKISIFNWGITVDVDIIKALSNMVYLKSLWLSGNTLTPSVSKYLSDSVRSLPQLEDLRMGRCGISNDDCVDLVSSLSKHCPRLRKLTLYHNHLLSGYSQVVDDVSKMNNLRGLWLYWNPCMKEGKKREEIKNRLKISNPQLTVYTTY